MRATNKYNSRKKKNASSVFKGVCSQQQGCKTRWRCRIRLTNGEQKTIGLFYYEYNAGLAHDVVARYFHGEFYKNQNFNNYEGFIPETDENAREKAENFIRNFA
jgi:hypothetical protein